MEIYAYIGDSELPSFDFDSLRILSYIKLTKAPVDIKLKGNPHHSPNGYLPYLKDGTEIIKSGYHDIVKYLISKGYDINRHLSLNDQSVSTGLIQYLFQNINPYFQYTLWGQPDNANDTRGYYVKKLAFPFYFYYPKKYHKAARQVLDSLTGIDIDDKVENLDVDELVISATKCVTLLSNSLDEKLWFFNSNCSELDITVYGYLMILLNIKLPHNPLEQHIKNCANLCKFMERIGRAYFADETIFPKPKENSKTKKSTESSRETSPGAEVDHENAAMRRIQVLSILGAIAAMAGFAVMNGIVSFSHSDGANEDQDLSDYYDDGNDDNYGD